MNLTRLSRHVRSTNHNGAAGEAVPCRSGLHGHGDGSLSVATMYAAVLSGADLTGAFLTRAMLTDVIWDNTVCPNGTVTDTGC